MRPEHDLAAHDERTGGDMVYWVLFACKLCIGVAPEIVLICGRETLYKHQIEKHFPPCPNCGQKCWMLWLGETPEADEFTSSCNLEGTMMLRLVRA